MRVSTKESKQLIPLRQSGYGWTRFSEDNRIVALGTR